MDELHEKMHDHGASNLQISSEIITVHLLERSNIYMEEEIISWMLIKKEFHLERFEERMFSDTYTAKLVTT